MLYHSGLNLNSSNIFMQAQDISLSWYDLIWIYQSPFAAIPSFPFRLHSKTIVATITTAIKTLITQM